MTLTYITAPWCPTCKALMPRVKELAVTSNAQFEEIDLGTPVGESLAIDYAPTALPTVVVRQGTSLFARFSGAVDMSALKKALTV